MDPLSAVTTIAAASQNLGEWLGRSLSVASTPPAGSFAAVLQGPASPAPSLDELRQRLQQMVDDTLTALGLAPASPLELSVGCDGRLRLQSQHPRGAEIEAALSARGDLAALASQLAQATGGPVPLAWPAPATPASLTTEAAFPYTMH